MEDHEISTLLTLDEPAFYLKVYSKIEAGFFYERQPDIAEQEAQARDWLMALWHKHKKEICKLRMYFPYLKPEELVTFISGVVLPHVVNSDYAWPIDVLVVCQLLALLCVRLGLDKLCGDELE